MTNSRLLLTSGILLLSFAILAGCASPQRQFARAERLEVSGRRADALAVYQLLLARVPTGAAHTRSQIYYRMGECLFRMERIAEAFSAYQKAAEIDPSNVDPHLRLGEFYLAAGASGRARREAELVMAKWGERPQALALWGGVLAASGQVKPAEEAYRRAIAADPHKIAVALALADLYNQGRDVEQARKVLHDAAAANPKSATPWLALGRLHEQEGDIAAAEECYRKAVAAEDTPESNLRLAQFLQRASRINESEQVLRRVDAQRPAQPTALPDFEMIAGQPGTATEKYQAALSAAESTTQARPASAAAHEQKRHRGLLATRLVEADLDVAGRKSGVEKTQALQQARAHLEQYRADLDQATLDILQAEIAVCESNLPKAAELAQEAISLAPDSAPAYYVMGMVQHRSGKEAEARKHWQAALEADAHFVPAHLALSEQALAEGNAATAEEYVSAVVRDEPGNVRALNLFARVLLAERRYAAAALIAHRAMAVDMAMPEPHIVLGEIALRQSRLSDALIHFEQAVLLQPHSPEAIEGLTRVYRTGKVTHAMLAKMEKVAAADPPSATLMEIAGRLYAQHGWLRDAERSLQAALRIDAKRTTAATALARVYAESGQWAAAADSVSRTGGHSAALLAAVRAQERNDVPAAIRDYERAIREGEHSGIAANNLAWLYAEQGTNLDRALQLAETARAQAPENPAVLDTVGLVRLRLRRYSDAIRALESARRLAGERGSDRKLSAQIRRHLSEAYLRAGRPEAATAVENQ